jgi:hypothetical protein
MNIPPAFLWGRLPFQLVFIGWALWVGGRDRAPEAVASPGRG